MSIDKKQVQQVRDNLGHLASVIENIAYQNPMSAADLPDRSISGNKILGGKIAKFASTGIKDDSTRLVVLVNDDGILTDCLDVETLVGDVKVEGNLTVGGEITAAKLRVSEITADIRHEKSTPLEFIAGENDTVYGKGLQWKSNDPTKQFILRANPDRLYSSESIDLHRDKIYAIDNITVLSKDELGPTITKSNLNKVGVLTGLVVQGDVKIDEFLFWNSGSMRLGIGTDQPNAMLSLTTLTSEFIIDPEGDNVRIGTWTTDDIVFITDDTPRLLITKTGHIHLGPKGSADTKVTVNGRLGLGINNIKDDVSLDSAGAIRFQDKKFEVGSKVPINGSYKLGDIVWNSNPQPTGYVGWVCTREGTPGIWKPFGQIGS
jgi:hypothetical protein